MTPHATPPTDPCIRRHWILFRLRALGTSLAQIAREEGVSRNTPRKALDRPYPRMEAAIASRLGLTARELFPERAHASNFAHRKQTGKADLTSGGVS